MIDYSYVSLITEIANKVAKKKYPMYSEHRYCDFDVAVILHSYLVLVEQTNELSQQTEKESELPTVNN